MRPTFYVPVAGTFDCNESSWWLPNSLFNKFLKNCNIYPLRENCPFEWSTDLNGIPFISHLFSGSATKTRDWSTGGAALDYYFGYDRNFRNLEPWYNRNIICHSHGFQVVMYAASRGLKLNNVISVGSPIRADLSEVYKKARPNIKNLLSIVIKGDIWQLLGEIGDGHIGVVRENPYADRNDTMEKSYTHSDLLRDPTHYHHWLEKGWLEFLTSGVDV